MRGRPHGAMIEPWAPGWCTACGLPARDEVHGAILAGDSSAGTGGGTGADTVGGLG